MNEVAEPNKATAHIQKTAPGPPKAIAVATPAILPTPTRPAKDIISDWNDETPFSDFSPFFNCFSMSGMPRICRNLVVRVKYTQIGRASCRERVRMEGGS